MTGSAGTSTQNMNKFADKPKGLYAGARADNQALRGQVCMAEHDRDMHDLTLEATRLFEE